MDAGKYAESWQESAEANRKGVEKDVMVRLYEKIFTGTGKVKSRKLVNRTYTTTLPGAPPGAYVVLQYRTIFEFLDAVETVTPMLGKDGRWRVSGYQVRARKLFEFEEAAPLQPAIENVGEIRRLVGHNGKVIRVAVTPDGRLLASTGEDNTVRVWDTKTGKQLHEFPTRFKAIPVALSPDGKLVAAIVCPGPFPGGVIVWQLSDGKKLFEIKTISGWIGGITFSPDSRHVAWSEVFEHKTTDHAIRIVDAITGKEVRTIRDT